MPSSKSIQCVVHDKHCNHKVVLTFIRNSNGIFISRLGDNKFVRDVFLRLPLKSTDVKSDDFANLMIEISKEYELLVKGSYNKLISVEQKNLLFGFFGEDAKKGTKILPLIGTLGSSIPLLKCYVHSIGYDVNQTTSSCGSPIGETLDSAIQVGLSIAQDDVISDEDFVSEFERAFYSGDHKNYYECALLQ